MCDVRDRTQLLLLLRALYDNLPRCLEFLSVSEAHVGRGLDRVMRSMTRELMLTSQRQKTTMSHSGLCDDALTADELSALQLQTDTDNHLMSFLYSYY